MLEKKGFSKSLLWAGLILADQPELQAASRTRGLCSGTRIQQIWMCAL